MMRSSIATSPDFRYYLLSLKDVLVYGSSPQYNCTRTLGTRWMGCGILASEV
ncbi:hypothetical protein HKBW3S03_00382 [Candidatus Hakubella thermalkaliphila]|uniref:Uncharacterized protein n=1 Tax=Candidatus Hakubella thermalkaliphila TaxID=2754717 RepID=A0A6V8PVI5_9ACTN|nr:hypothetical protein [Actinomycetota bacterium]GFP18877.1 hypothetical protein HKBW3S03_00382 [Candidatus Hakubella thermalkaliphila]GFP30038.1 hypothetical protein HKBW3S34_00958 [Candidatus Hakubella thermalkaliphila]GFP36642.1 hypothetical protein HKBW3S44_00323 [Candidatus Hakubella thermalkaliphila]